jgi:hypothetical protein
VTVRVLTTCPVDPRHGRVLDAPGARWAFYCPSQDHDGRPNTHQLGSAPATRAYFTTLEVESGQLDPAPGSGQQPAEPPARTSADEARPTDLTEAPDQVALWA